MLHENTKKEVSNVKVLQRTTTILFQSKQDKRTQFESFSKYNHLFNFHVEQMDLTCVFLYN